MSAADVFNPVEHFVGWDADTGARAYVPIKHYLGRSAELIGPSGAGKTDLAMESCRTLTYTASGWIYFDFANTGFDQAIVWDAYAAEHLLTGTELPYADAVPEFVGITDAFIRRNAYATVGGLDPVIRINPFRRCRFPDGTVESVEDAVDRIERVFAAQYPDLGVHVQFTKNLRIVVTNLIAAEQRISDWSLLLTSPDYRRFVRQRQEETGTAADAYVRHQREQLEALLALPPRDLRLEIHSLTTRMDPFTSGSLAAFFSDENFALEDVAYRGRRLFLSVAGLNSTERRKFVMRILWAMLDTLIAKRRFHDQDPIGIEFIDEISWLPADFFDTLTRRRNNRWSSITARQTLHQFETLGFKRAHELSAASSGTRVLYGPPETMAEARELAARLYLLRPDGAWVERIVETHSAAQASGSSLSRKESVAEVDTHTRTTGTSTTEQTDAMGLRTGTTKGISASDGITSGTNRSTGMDHGTSHVDTYGVSRTRTPYRIPYDEQLAYLAQAILQPPARLATIETPERKQRVLMARARQLPVVGVGVDIVENYLRLNTAGHRACTVVLPRFEPSVRVIGRLAAPVEGEEGSSTAPASRPIAARPGRPTAGPTTDSDETDDGDVQRDTTRVASDGETGEDRSGDGDESAPACLPTLPSGEGAGAQEPDVLALVATIRFATVQTLILLTTWNYDKAYRTFEALRKGELVERFQQVAGREKGSVPAVYVLSGAGANRLAPAWPGGAVDLQRLVKNVGTRRRDVEDGKATNLGHALATGSLFALLTRHARDLDPSTVIDAIHWDRSLSIPVDVGPWLGPLTDRERLLLGPEVAAGTSTIVRYVPDLAFRITWKPPGFTDRITEVLLAEVETGAGGRDAGEIGAVKGAKIAALLEGVDRAGTVGPIALPNPKLAKVLFWCGTPHVEQGLRPGLLRGLGPARRPVVTTNASFLPLTPPPGTGKKELPAVLAALAQAVGGPAWKWYREGETAPRFGYPRDPSPPKPR